MRISASGIVQILEFYDYRNSIQSSVVIHLLNLATSSALRHPSGSPVATSEIQYWATDVQLILYPEEHMTWRMWRNALVGMKKFVALEGMSYGWSFVVMDKGKSFSSPIRLRRITFHVIAKPRLLASGLQSVPLTSNSTERYMLVVPHDVLGWGVLTNVTDDKLRTAPVDPNKQ